MITLDFEAHDRQVIDDLENRIAALEAQLAERVKVKPLEWLSDGVWLKAYAPFGGIYRITEYSGMAKPFKLEISGFVGLSGHFELADEAKAAAQADFDRRILSALEATPPAQACETCNGTGNEARHSICRDCEEATAPKVTEDDVARRIFNDAHAGMRNCYDWDTPGLEGEHPGTIDRYRGYARSAIAAITAAQEEED